MHFDFMNVGASIATWPLWLLIWLVRFYIHTVTCRQSFFLFGDLICFLGPALAVLYQKRQDDGTLENQLTPWNAGQKTHGLPTSWARKPLSVGVVAMQIQADFLIGSKTYWLNLIGISVHGPKVGNNALQQRWDQRGAQRNEIKEFKSVSKETKDTKGYHVACRWSNGTIFSMFVPCRHSIHWWARPNWEMRRYIRCVVVI